MPSSELNQIVSQYSDQIEAQMSPDHHRNQMAAVSRLATWINGDALGVIDDAKLGWLIEHTAGRTKSDRVDSPDGMISASTARNDLRATMRFLHWAATAGYWSPPASFPAAIEQKLGDLKYRIRTQEKIISTPDLRNLLTVVNETRACDICAMVLAGLNFGFLPRHCGLLSVWDTDLLNSQPSVSPGFFKQQHDVGLSIWPETGFVLRLALIGSLADDKRLRPTLQRNFKIPDPDSAAIERYVKFFMASGESYPYWIGPEHVTERQIYTALVGALFPREPYHDRRRYNQLVHTFKLVRESMKDRVGFRPIDFDTNGDHWRSLRFTAGLSPKAKFGWLRNSTAAFLSGRSKQTFLSLTKQGEPAQVSPEAMKTLNDELADWREELGVGLANPRNNWHPLSYLWYPENAQ